jgi:peptidoglycan hydrolase-like protein with peptidoglycan-binding domain
LATPYELAGPCHESDPNTNAFVQGMVLDRTTGQVSLYNPLVVDRGSQPAIQPVVPALPSSRVVAIWVGFNGNTLSLVGRGRRACLQGVRGSVFGQNAFCNAEAFYDAVHAAIRTGQLPVPPLGTARDGKPCPTSRDFSIVDQDQSDNTTTTYLVTADGSIAQNTPANAAKLPGSTIAFNGSDERLTSVAVDKALGCTPWKVPDLADTTHAVVSPAWPTNEVFAGMRQAAPVALIPALDPFAQVNGKLSLRKLNLYRAGVDQPQVGSLAGADTKTYCQNLLRAGLPRVAADKPFTSVAASPFPDLANTLSNFLALRFNQTFTNLTCDTLLNLSNPVTLTTMDGIVVDATINLNPGRPIASASRTN